MLQLDFFRFTFFVPLWLLFPSQSGWFNNILNWFDRWRYCSWRSLSFPLPVCLHRSALCSLHVYVVKFYCQWSTSLARPIRLLFCCSKLLKPTNASWKRYTFSSWHTNLAISVNLLASVNYNFLSQFVLKDLNFLSKIALRIFSLPKFWNWKTQDFSSFSLYIEPYVNAIAMDSL